MLTWQSDPSLWNNSIRITKNRDHVDTTSVTDHLRLCFFWVEWLFDKVIEQKPVVGSFITRTRKKWNRGWQHIVRGFSTHLFQSTPQIRQSGWTEIFKGVHVTTCVSKLIMGKMQCVFESQRQIIVFLSPEFGQAVWQLLRWKTAKGPEFVS